MAKLITKASEYALFDTFFTLIEQLPSATAVMPIKYAYSVPPEAILMMIVSLALITLFVSVNATWALGASWALLIVILPQVLFNVTPVALLPV